MTMLDRHLGVRQAVTMSMDPSDMPFILAQPDRILATQGCAHRLEIEHSAMVEERVSAFFRKRENGVPLLVGAFPFDRAKAPQIYQPASVLCDEEGADVRLHLSALLPHEGRPAHGDWTIAQEPPRAHYVAAVAKALDRIDNAGTEPGLEKVVLARALRLRSDHPISASRLARRLLPDNAATLYCTPIARGMEKQLLMGASPELLVTKSGKHVFSHPLAGSARRATDAAEDRAAAESLLHSSKDLREHAFVKEAILDLLAPLCSDLSAPAEPALTSTHSMWHLGSKITAFLKDEHTTAAGLAALLHPTPAVCGTPTQAAYEVIDSVEEVDRGFYAGAVGTCNANGDGTWYVAIRCVELGANQARAFAGAGIVAGSDPEQEADETAAKFKAILDALEIDAAVLAKDFSS